MSTWKCLQDLLWARAAAAESEASSKCLLFYPPGNTNCPRTVSYRSLYNQATEISIILRGLEFFKKKGSVLLHLDDHWDTILWFWAVLLAQGLPVLSSPFSNVEDHRQKHIRALSTLLESPICITRSESVNLFGDDHGMQLLTIESLLDNTTPPNSTGSDACQARCDAEEQINDDNTSDSDLSMLMLTSGSTGNAKAVRLTHKQVLASVAGKSAIRLLPSKNPFLNWVGLDHVGALVEIHLHALWLGVDQVHVSAADVISSPRTFLDLLSRHQISRSFAPNFFLARLVSEIIALNSANNTKFPTWDLSSLLFLVSGGEANDIKVCIELSYLLAKYGAPPNVIAPGFGMTETCAGSIYNINCPEYDIANGHTVASLGKCIKGIEMRIAESGINKGIALTGEPGELQLRGPVVFKGYYRNPEATDKAFTSDGWFRTGDQATIDVNGNLGLIGRVDDVININGVKINAAVIQTSLEEALGSLVARVVVFATRAAHTEQITVCYIPKIWPMEAQNILEIDQVAGEVCMFSAASKPLVFSIRDHSLPLLPVSALGKISRAKMRRLFEEHKFDEEIRLSEQEFRCAKEQVRGIANRENPANDTEALLVIDFAEVSGISPDAFDVNTPLFELEFSSLHFIQLKHRIDTRHGTSLPLIMMLKNPTVRSLANILNSNEATFKTLPYDPVVTFRSSGTKTPLWLIHPGVGEVLVFVGLAQHLQNDDRPLYAMRARGFEESQDCFTSIAEVADTYVAAILQRQPRGPYALAGYSYGAMLAFEIAKKLNATADMDSNSKVGFLGSFNLPPHIKWRMRQLDWNMCLLNLTHFVGLTTEDYAHSFDQEAFRAIPNQEALEKVLADSDQSRMEELGLERGHLSRWVDVAYSLQSMAVDYEPIGQVEAMDIFHCEPLKAVAPSSEVWIHDHLSNWSKFSRTAPVFHHVSGAHYTMLDADHVLDFYFQLKSALEARGL